MLLVIGVFQFFYTKITFLVKFYTCIQIGAYIMVKVTDRI